MYRLELPLDRIGHHLMLLHQGLPLEQLGVNKDIVHEAAGGSFADVLDADAGVADSVGDERGEAELLGLTGGGEGEGG